MHRRVPAGHAIGSLALATVLVVAGCASPAGTGQPSSLASFGTSAPASLDGGSADPGASPAESAVVASPSPLGSPIESQGPIQSAGASSPSPQPSPSGPPRVRALAEREVFGFLPYWQMSDPKTQVPLDTLTTIAIFGVEAGRDGHLVEQTSSGGVPSGWAAWNSSTTTQLIARAHAANVRVVLTIQRFSWTPNQARRTVALLSDPARRQILAQDIVAELDAKQADGVNLLVEATI